MSDTRILWSYPFVFRRIRRVDAKYAYLVVNDGYVPLRRREGCLSVLLPYVKYGEWKTCYDETYDFVNLVLETLDDVSDFFQTQMEDEYLLEEEYDVSEYGKIWDVRFDEMYGMRKHVKKYVAKNREERELEYKRRLKLEELYKKS